MSGWNRRKYRNNDKNSASNRAYHNSNCCRHS